MQIEPLNINPYPDNNPGPAPIDLSQGASPMDAVPSPPIAQTKGAKAAYGLNRNEQDTVNAILSGREKDLRNEAAASADFAKSLQRQRFISQVTSQVPDAAALAKDQEFISKLTGRPEPTDPRSVIEEYYSGRYLQPMINLNDKFVGSTYMPSAVAYDPKEVSDTMNSVTDTLTYKEYAFNRYQKSLDTYKDQSWAGWLTDQTKMLSGTYIENKLRGYMPDTYFKGLLGDELEAQRQELYKLPFNEFKDRFDAIMDHLERDNPRLAVMFANAVVGQSADDIQKNNASTLINLTGDLSVAGGLLKKFVRGVAQSLFKSTAALEETNATTFDVKRAVASGLGNEAEAATQMVAKETWEKLNGKVDTTGQSIEHLQNYLRFDAKYRKGNPGKSGQEIANRVYENSSSLATSLEDTVRGLLRVDRTPALSANNVVAEMAKDSVSKKYSGPNSTVVKVHDPVWSEDPTAPDFIRGRGTNTMWIAVDTVGHDAEIFPDIERAIGHADDYGITLSNRETDVKRNLENRITESNFKIADFEKKIKEYIPHIDETETNVMRSELRAMRDINDELKSQLSRVVAKPELNKKIPSIFGADVVQSGTGYVIRHWHPNDETQTFMRDNLLNMPNSWSGPASKQKRGGLQTPYLIDPITGKASTRFFDTIKAFTNSGGSANMAEHFDWRTPEETLSPVENEQRKIVTHGVNRLIHVVMENDKLVSSALRYDNKTFKRLIIQQQNMVNPLDPKDWGYFFKTIPELEHWYESNAGRLPHDREIAGYFAYVDNWETERTFRTMGMARNMYRLGIQRYRIRDNDLGWSDWFHARELDHFPGKVDDSVYLGKGVLGESQVASGVGLNAHLRKQLKPKFDKGEVKVLQLWNREDRPFHSFDPQTLPTDSEPSYAIVTNIDRSALNWNELVPRRGGGHWTPEDNYRVAKANVRVDPVTGLANYKGDITAFTSPIRALGEKFAKHLNNIQEYVDRKDLDGARNYVKSSGFQGLDFDKHLLPNWRGTKAPKGGRLPPKWDTKEPFRVIGMDESIIDQDKELENRYRKEDGTSIFRDTTTSTNLAKANAIEFTQRRDMENLFSVSDVGTKDNPIFQFHATPLIDPVDSLNRSMGRIINQTFMDDYKHFGAEHWLQTFLPWLDDPDRLARHSPFSTFLNPKFKRDTPENIKAIAMANRKKIKDFIGQPSSIDSALHAVTSRLADSIYKGTGKTIKRLEFIPGEKDPLVALTSLTYHAKLGLFSIPIFWTQATAFTNVLAINFRHAPAATIGALLHEYSRYMPQHIDKLDEMATRLSMPGFSKWKPGELKEAWNILTKETGFFEVGREHAMWDTMFKNKAITSWKDAALYWGDTAFREGAQWTRAAAWYSAYKEFRHTNPVKALTRADKAWILDRATLLDHNMSRASNSAINTGFMRPAAQFYTYARNLAEMFYGKRLTVGEKARLFAVSSVLWGVPAGGIGLLGLPVADWIRKQAIEGNLPGQNTGYVPGFNQKLSFAMEGLPSWLGAMITGHGDPQAGTWYNFSKFGVKGWDPLDNFLAQDKTWMDFLGGATFSTWKNTLSRGKELWQDMAALMQPDNPDRIKLKAMDIADLFKEVSAAGYGTKLWMGISAGKWMSNNNTPLDDVSWGDAIYRFLTGTIPVDIADISTNRNVIDDRASFVKLATNRYARNYNLAMLALKDGDTHGYTDYMKKAKAWLDRTDFPPNERSRVISEINGRRPTLLQSIEEQLHKKDVPQDQLEQQQEMFREREIIKQKKRENR